MQHEFEIWLDTHVSSIVAKWIVEDFGFACKSSYILNLHGIDDVDIYKKAKAARRIIVMTRDIGFANYVGNKTNGLKLFCWWVIIEKVKSFTRIRLNPIWIAAFDC